MIASEKHPCFSCGEPVSVAARICPICNRSVLVNVGLARPVTDNRLRYQMARALSALGAPLPGFVEIQNTLAAPAPTLARSVTRSAANRIAEVISRFELEAVLSPVSGSGGARSMKSVMAIAAVVVVCGLLLWLGLRRGGGDRQQVVRDRSSRQSASEASAAITPKSLTTREIAALLLSSTVSLRCQDSVGAGFFVTDELLLTNAHVLCSDRTPPKAVFADGRQLPSELARSDVQLDLALLKVSGASVKPLQLGAVEDVQVGDKVMLVGSPVGLEFTVHEGTVSSLSRALYGIALIQLDAKINPGNSGGPLVDSFGRVIGIVSLKHTQAEGIGLALPIDYAYSGSEAILPDSLRRASSQAFDDHLKQAQNDEARAVSELGAIQLLPGLVGAEIDQYRNLVARIAIPSRGQPRFMELEFKVRSGSEEVCVLKGDVVSWKLLEEVTAFQQLDARAHEWLKKHQLDAEFYVGETALRWDLCPQERMRPGIVLELQNASPHAARLQLY